MKKTNKTIFSQTIFKQRFFATKQLFHFTINSELDRENLEKYKNDTLKRWVSGCRSAVQ